MNFTSLSILSFILHANQLDRFQSLVFVSSPDPSEPQEEAGRSLVEGVAIATQMPIISLTYDSSVTLAKHFNRELLVIVDLQSEVYSHILGNVAALLHLMTKSRVILVLDQEAPNNDVVSDIFEICWKLKLINAVAVSRDFSASQVIFSYDPYPSFRVERRSAGKGAIFLDRVKDMKGAALKVFADQIAPMNMLAPRPDGSVGVYGYAGHILNCFFKKHNATMDFAIPFTIGKSVLYMGLRELLFNDTLDLLISLILHSPHSEPFSYTVDQTSFCLMVPVEDHLPTREFFLAIVDPAVTGLIFSTALILSALLVAATNRLHPRKAIRLSEILLNDICLRGVLWQPFTALRRSTSLMKFVYFLMSLQGVYFTTWYLAYMQAYLTHPPSKHRIERSSDLRNVDFKVNFFQKEYVFVEDLILEFLHPSVITITESFTEYLRLMDSLDRHYAYTLQTSKWNIYKGQQELFSKPLFRLTKICGMVGSQQAFPLHPNSVHMDALNRVIMQVQDSGLLRYWIDRSFYELVQIGRMNFSDWTKPDQGIGGLRLQDLSLVLLYFVGAQMGSLLVFAMEVVAGRKGRSMKGKQPSVSGSLQI